jgi:DNA mismatch endonuclease (patch repair protein)
VIFVHGCYWHKHSCRYGRVTPRTNAEFWRTKRESNVKRDMRQLKVLRSENWRVLTVWECETKDMVKLRRKLSNFLAA